MRTLVALAAILFALPSLAQGTLNFNNRTPTGDAPVSNHGGWGAGASVVAQLYLVTRSGASEVLKPLFPTTTFRTSSAAAAFFINPINPFVVDGVPPGQPATVRMVVYYGPSYEIAVKNNWEHGRSNDVLIPQLGGTLESGEIIPTPGLNGLEAFMFSPLDGLDPAPRLEKDQSSRNSRRHILQHVNRKSRRPHLPFQNHRQQKEINNRATAMIAILQAQTILMLRRDSYLDQPSSTLNVSS